MEHTAIPTEELEVFKALKDIKIVFDVGARVDIDYLRLKPDIELHAFEPNHGFFKSLVKIVAEHGGKGKVYLNRFGLGDIAGWFPYNVGRQAFLGGECPINRPDVGLEISTLDNYVKENKIKSIDFLKIDVEGYEYKVLLGGKKTIPKCKYIQYEHWDNKQEYHDLLEKRFDMEYIGYRNVLCMNKKLVDKKTRQELKDFIRKNNFKDLS